MFIIPMDTHSDNIEVIVFKKRRGKLVKLCEKNIALSLKSVRDLLDDFQGPRVIITEEGPSASWLYRNLHNEVDDFFVSDPVTNAYIYKDDAKGDKIDTKKLATLYLSNALKRVYHTKDLERQKFKDLLLHYRDISKDAVRIKNKVKALYRRYGYKKENSEMYSPAFRQKWIRKIRDQVCPCIIENLYSTLDKVESDIKKLKMKLERKCERNPVTRRFLDIHGVGVITAATFYAIVDTPWRFSTLKKLWRYCGLAVGGKRSNNKLITRPGLDNRGNRMLKDVLLTAAKGCKSRGSRNPLSNLFYEKLSRGCTAESATNTTARKICQIMFVMWKTGSKYRPELV